MLSLAMKADSRRVRPYLYVDSESVKFKMVQCLNGSVRLIGICHML